MVLEKINLINFRNYENEELTFHPSLNIFIGKNGMGKTNILESIYALAITKSHRTQLENVMVRNQAPGFRIQGTLKGTSIFNDTYEYIYTIDNNQKKVLKNKTEIKKISDYLSNINVILFSPESIELLKGSPSYRRKFLNIEIGQVNNQYIKWLNEYNYYLKIRNDLLKKLQREEPVDDIYFSIVTERMVARAVDIYQERQNFLLFLNQTIEKIYEGLTKMKGLQLQYDTNIPLEKEKEKNRITLLKKYEKNRKKEIFLGSTSYGPHRDDFSFCINGKNMLEFSSQGQQRLATLALKLSEIKLFKKATNRDPIVLLDDVFSELDYIKKNNILNKINKNSQIFITTNDLANIEEKYLVNAKIFVINQGKITIRRGGKK